MTRAEMEHTDQQGRDAIESHCTDPGGHKLLSIVRHMGTVLPGI